MQVLTVTFFSPVSNQSTPLIPWTSEHEEAFSSPTFRQLLGELGFHMPSETGKLYPRIPHFWCPEVLYMVAKRLGDITESESIVSDVSSAYLLLLCLIHTAKIENTCQENNLFLINSTQNTYCLLDTLLTCM